MSKDKVKEPVILQVLPELGQGGVELGTVQIAEHLTETVSETMSPVRAAEWSFSLKEWA